MQTGTRSVALATSPAFTAPALAPDEGDILAVTTRFQYLGNKLDQNSASTLSADQVVIIDTYDPYKQSE